MKPNLSKVPRFLRSRMSMFILMAGALGVAVIYLLMRESGQAPVAELVTTRQPSPQMEDGTVRYSTSVNQADPALEVTNRRTASPMPETRTREPRVATNMPVREEEEAPPPPPPVAINLYTTTSWGPQPKEDPVEASEVIRRQREKLILSASAPARDKEPEYAPFGRMLKCELVNTVDSTDSGAPIIGLVTESLYWNGELIVPANSEVHGIARVDRERERILSERDWVIVMHAEGKERPGRELRVRGVALDGDNRSIEHGGKPTWGITDGSLGIKGMTINNISDEEIKLFASAFMTGIAEGFTERQTLGENGPVTAIPTARNAALGGLSNVLSEYASRIEAEIERNGFYTRVPGGKQFMLYIEDVLLPEKATVGISYQEPIQPPQPVTQGTLNMPAAAGFLTQP
jgi:hypothetical protein